MTQEKVANIVGVTKTQISDIENNLSKPSYELQIKLEDLFKMNHRELFEPVKDEDLHTA
jgi:DNA-binding XRE family transcriptional regulator